MPKLIYISHPISGNVDENVRDILRICKKIHTKNIIPFAPYLVAVQYLDDKISRERKLGIQAGFECFSRKAMDELWLCGDKISKGMKEEIKLAIKYKIPIKCYNKKLKSEFNKIKSNLWIILRNWLKK